MRETISDLELENRRKKAKGRVVVAVVLTVLVVVAALILFVPIIMSDSDYTLYEKIGGLIIGTAAVAIGAFYLFFTIFVNRAYRHFNDAYKNKYVLPLIEESGIFEDIRYDAKQGFDWDTIRNAAVVNCGDKKYFTSEDMLEGRYKNVSFGASDVKAKILKRRGKRSELETVFSGQILRFSTFHDTKESRGYLQIFQKEFLSNIQGWTAEHAVKTENEAFNRRFQIFAEDEHNAYYILTPQFMEKIEAFANEINEQIAICFHQSSMYVAIKRTKSMFDAGVDVPIAEQKQDILADIKLLQDAGDILLCITETK
ncbi:MAG: DUF3137 domain-containing protein [Roseburia sp.]